MSNTYKISKKRLAQIVREEVEALRDELEQHPRLLEQFDRYAASSNATLLAKG